MVISSVRIFFGRKSKNQNQKNGSLMGIYELGAYTIGRLHHWAMGPFTIFLRSSNRWDSV